MTSHFGALRLLRYDRANLRGDVVGGITVTAYLIPQVMAYSSLAGLSPSAGLWVIVVTMVVYALIGSSRLLSVGPESTTALMTAAILGGLALGDPARYASLAALLALLVGIFAVISWALRLGFIGDLISKPVLVGYMAGVAVIMVTSQLGKITGVSLAGDTFRESMLSFAQNAPGAVSWPTVALGLAVTVLLLVLTPRFRRLPVPLFVVLGATAIVWFFHLEDHGIATVVDMQTGPPHFGIPHVGMQDVTLLLLPALGILVVGYTDNVATARIFATRSGHRVHNNQEFLALGAANAAAGLAAGFPVSSSASRSVIAEASGARTQLYSLISAALVIVSILLFAPVISAFPAAALGGLVVYAAIHLVQVSEFRRMWSFRRREFLIAISALVGVLAFDILYGVLVAVAISIIELLTRVARPHAAVLGQNPEVAGWHDVDDYPDTTQIPGLLVFRYDSPLFFANAENFADSCIKAIDAQEQAHPGQRLEWFLLNMEGNTEVDITGLDALDEVRRACERRDIVLALVRVKHETIDMLDRYGLADSIGRDRIYPTLPTAVAAFEKWRAHRSA